MPSDSWWLDGSYVDNDDGDDDEYGDEDDNDDWLL